MNDLGKRILSLPGVSGVGASMNNDLIVYLAIDSPEVRDAVRETAGDAFASITFTFTGDVTASSDSNLPALPF